MPPKTRAVKASPEKKEASPPPKATPKAEKKAKPVATTPLNSNHKRIGVAIAIALLAAAYTLSLPKTQISEWEIPDHFWYNEVTKESQWEEPVYEFQTDEGQTYFWDPEKKETFWEKPDSLQWEPRTDDEGNTYYFNAATAETQSETPTALAWVRVPYSKEDYAEQYGSGPETAAEL